MDSPRDPSLPNIIRPTLDAYPQPRQQTREAWFRSIASGQVRGLVPFVVRSALAVAEVPYALVMRWRNWRYDVDPRRITQVDVPVVSVGNLTLGGTGKTPVVEWIARWFRQHHTRVTIVSRGYGGQHGARNDEALELEERLDDVPHLQNPDRIEAAQLAIEEFECELILLDDGFQHRRLGRDLDVVLVDALDPFGCNHVFPRGLLREPIAGIRRAKVILLSRADQVDTAARAAIRKAYEQYAPTAVWAEVRHAPREVRDAHGQTETLALLQNQRIAGVCGIGNPAGFRHTLAQCGATLVELREYPDHHQYDRADLNALEAWAQQLDADWIVCTHKDLVKLRVDSLGGKPLIAIVIGIEFLSGQAEVEAQLQAIQQRVDERRALIESED